MKKQEEKTVLANVDDLTREVKRLKNSNTQLRSLNVRLTEKLSQAEKAYADTADQLVKSAKERLEQERRIEALEAKSKHDERIIHDMREEIDKAKKGFWARLFS